MALSESAIDELLNAIDVGDGTDLIRDLVRWLVQELIEAERPQRSARIATSAQASG